MTDRDPGLQPERTRLAWRRTTLSFTVAAVLAGKQALDGATPAGVVAAAFGLLLWVAFLWVAHRRMVDVGAAPRPPVMSPRGALTAAACTVALAVFGVAIVR
ncbi:DUF202 domain-containing protein [Streptomyces beijiangensis]|uniref:DUF202 domain-containing protein n=1 Tax=Streptomyces beijiangensis TaxID=163361 RepID=A0A939F8Q6_9ACTN|nr:DUF202 domain-containing protein [Streptomyces beijiangensis]MBO0513623.1 DUF202 domain-containing protein [Streptomyces beijiangensis]